MMIRIISSILILELHEENWKIHKCVVIKQHSVEQSVCQEKLKKKAKLRETDIEWWLPGPGR